jgi:hypothetical protein
VRATRRSAGDQVRSVRRQAEEGVQSGVTDATAGANRRGAETAATARAVEAFAEEGGGGTRNIGSNRARRRRQHLAKIEPTRAGYVNAIQVYPWTDLAGVNRNYVGNIERAEYAATVDIVDKLALALEIDAIELLKRPRKPK